MTDCLCGLCYREKLLLKMPPNLMFHPNGAPNNLVHWPLFLLANKVFHTLSTDICIMIFILYAEIRSSFIVQCHLGHAVVRERIFLFAGLSFLGQVHIAVELAAQHKTTNQDGLWEKVRRDEYMASAVQETFETLEPLLLHVLHPEGRSW